MKTYIAFTTDGSKKAYICEANSKKQMKEKGMNMRLDWQEVESFANAENWILCSGYKLANATRLTSI